MPKDAYLESRVLTADPLELIHLLYEHARLQVTTARDCQNLGDIRGRASAIDKALAALGELEGSLDYKAGGAIAQNLGRLYQYMRKRLVDGSVRQADAPLAEVEKLLRTLDEGWTAMQRAISAPPASLYGELAAEMAVSSWSA